MTLASRLRAITDPLPPGASVTLPADAVREWLDAEPATAPEPVQAAGPVSWRERIWTCDGDVRLGVLEVAEALDRGRDWVYRACSAEKAREKGREPLPCSRLDGELTFRVADVRDWVRRSELIVNPPPRMLRAS